MGFLRQMPGMKILAPASLLEQKEMLSWAVELYNGPVAVRYPRGEEGEWTSSAWDPADVSPDGCFHVHRQGKDVTFVTYGRMVNQVLRAAEKLETAGVSAEVIRLLTLDVFPSGEAFTAYLRPCYRCGGGLHRQRHPGGVSAPADGPPRPPPGCRAHRDSGPGEIPQEGSGQTGL